MAVAMANVEIATPTTMPVLTSKKRPQENNESPQSLKKLQVFDTERPISISAIAGPTDENDQYKEMPQALKEPYASAIIERTQEDDQDHVPQEWKEIQVLDTGNTFSSVTGPAQENDQVQSIPLTLTVLDAGNNVRVYDSDIIEKTQEKDQIPQALTELKTLDAGNSVDASSEPEQTQENDQMSHELKERQVLDSGNSVSCSYSAKIEQVQKNEQGQKMPHSLKELQILDTGNAVSAASITDRMKHLFPKINVMPCKSARIFACFTLVAEQRSQQTGSEGRESRHSQSAKHVKPLLTLLSALVTVEQTSLGGEVTNATVYFSGFDCSSTPPPVDSLWGSQVYLEASIEALGRAVDEFQMLRSCGENSAEVVSCLQSIISFLKEIESNEGAKMREECSKTMPSQWPSRRFEKAASSYREDFENLLITVQNESSIRQPLWVEKHLADFLGQAIRFYLRIFFNPVPWKQIPGQEVEQLPSKVSKVQSRISKMLTMELPERVVVADSAVADGAVSSVFSMALRVVNSHFGYEALSSKEYCAPGIPAGFCQSAASQRGPGTRRNQMTADDAETVLSDIHTAQDFLVAFRACRFLSDLITFPGVQEEIARVGGWEMVESHARKILQYDLKKWCPNDAHLVVLSDAGHFFQRIESYKTAMEISITDCEQSLGAMRERFKCGPNHRGNRKMIATVLEEERSRFVFPTVVPMSN